MLQARRRRSTATCPARRTRYFYEPRGVAVVIAPWNFPLAILTGMTAAALVTGNTVDHEAGRAVVGHRARS